MRLRVGIALLFLLSACATSAPSPSGRLTRSPRIANLQRAATLPWRDGGHCVVQEASHPWSVLVERCFQALDHERIRFRDPTGRCAVASTGTAALGIGLCVLAAPEIVVGAVIVAGVVVVGIAIKEALEAYESAPQTQPASREPSANRKPEPAPSGQDSFPPVPTEPSERARRPECTPRPVPHLGGNDLHNRCADRVPQNQFSGGDVLVNGKNFDALQLATRTLWEVKTTDIESYSPYVQEAELRKQLEEGRREKAIAAACGYQFVIGVRSQAHKTMLEARAPDLTVVLMPWC